MPSETLALIVEDNPALLSVFMRTAERAGFATLAAESPEEAVRLCDQHGSEIALVISDVFLSGSTGMEIAATAILANPGVKVLLTSGSSMEFWRESDLRKLSVLPEGSVVFLPKPFCCNAMIACVHRLISRQTDISATA